MKLSLVWLVFGLLLSFASPVNGTKETQQNDPVKLKASDLEVSLVADKHSYRAGDRINLEVKLTNGNGVKDLFVYGELGFGLRASFTLFRRDAKGREVPTRFIDDDKTYPPEAGDKTAFVKLHPNHFLGITYPSSIQELNMERPGKYTMWVEYHCRISGANVEVSPFWSREDGPIKSNVVEIEVLR